MNFKREPDDGLHQLMFVGTGAPNDPKRVTCTRCLLSFGLGQSILGPCGYQAKPVSPSK